MPVTFYQSLQDVPDYSNYSMKGRTYRYYNGKVQYPFGFGLSYASFTYSWNRQVNIVRPSKDTLAFSVTVKNTGGTDGDEALQAYIQYPNLESMPLKELKAFKKISVAKAKEQIVQFKIPVKELEKWDLQQHKWRLYSGNYQLLIGSSSEDIKLRSTIEMK